MDSLLVYSTDPDKNKTCPKCKNLISECSCSKGEAKKKNEVSAFLSIEKSGRRGKTVTVVNRLPASETFLEDLAKKLKMKCGSGGTYFIDSGFGRIEIQA